MASHQPPRPTDAELQILQVLWDRGSATVRDVHDQLSAKRDVGYTTVLKLLQIMMEKGLVVRDAAQRTHVYRARKAAEQTQRQLVSDLLSRAFGGATDRLVMQALRAKKITPSERAEIRKLLNELEGDSP